MLGVNDILITPLFISLLYIFVFMYFRLLKRSPRTLRRYFIIGMSLRVFGSICVGLIYHFYYKGGDTLFYFKDSIVLNEALFTDTGEAISLYFADINSSNFYQYWHITRNIFYSMDPSSFFVVKTTALINVLTYNTYTSTAIFFALIGFSGAWKLFVILKELYPASEKQLAIAILFIPSVFFWGAGILKDTLTLSALCWVLYGAYQIIIKNKNRLLMSIIVLICVYIIYRVKVYILLCFVPGVALWLFLNISNKVKNQRTRSFIKPILLVASIGMGVVLVGRIVENDRKYSFDKIVETSQVTAKYIAQVSKESGGAVYDIGQLDFTVGRLATVFPNAIIVTLFRPFIWEVRNPMMLFSALESLFMFIITFTAIRRNGLKGSFRIIIKDPFLIFSFAFAIFFAFAVGVSTNNFGSLARYKIPLIPFYVAGMYILRDHKAKEK